MNIRVTMLILFLLFYPLEIISQILDPKDLENTNLDLKALVIEPNKFLINDIQPPDTSQNGTIRSITNNKRLYNGYLLSESIFQEWIGAGWQNSSKRNCTYNNENLIAEDLHQNWSDTNWVNNFKKNCQYDLSSNLISELSQNWDGFNWNNSGLVTYTYNSSNSKITELYQSWDGSDWLNNSIYIYV
jgi:hypothetical protein